MKRQIQKLDEINRRLRDEAQALELKLSRDAYLLNQLEELKLGRDGYLLNQLEDLKSKNMELTKKLEKHVP